MARPPRRQRDRSGHSRGARRLTRRGSKLEKRNSKLPTRRLKTGRPPVARPLRVGDFPGGLRAGSTQRNVAQEVVIARRRELDMGDAPAMYTHVVEVPEVEVGHVVGDDVLDLAEDPPALLAVGLYAGLVEQGIEPWVAVVDSVGSIGRNLSRVEDVFKDVWIVVGPYPAQRIELEIAVSDVGIERGELERAQLELDPDAPPLFLQHFAQQAHRLFGRTL